ncbi:nuclear hormone receptor HR96 isoform X2 [Eurosta solidaginis]|uniref:nuclear hormone receptor HR96 isoform X2 n=1 Tax=Eurosta solidaginis TaxID=178769 RepID=UPI0035317815
MEMSPPKRCAVCGDKALGYNFNAVTCESCKAFFRRNALSKKEFTCPFSQNCEITVVTRRFCQRCRLKKCLDIGMKSENIMSEEDKVIKRRKIESNRAKRRLNEEGKTGSTTRGENNAFDTASHDSESSYDSGKGTASNNSVPAALTNLTSPINVNVPVNSPLLSEVDAETKHELMTSEEIVEFIVGDPDRASQAISKLMRTKDDALSIVEKILTSQKDALRLVSHLIAFPGDALKIISKIMNSPFDALTVFTKFMSSPTDALEIISKIVSSPQDVVQFIRSLMECPEDALDIMHKFMNTPAEALRIINKIFNKLNPPSDELHKLLIDASKDSKDSTFQAAQALRMDEISEAGNDLLQSILDNSPIMTPQMTNELPPPNSQQEQQSIFANSNMIEGTHMNIPTTAIGVGTETSGQSILLSSVNELSISTCLVSSAQAMSISSPSSVDGATQADSIQQYNSPASIHHEIEFPSTSAALMNTKSARSMTHDNTGYCRDNFDMKTFLQQSYAENIVGEGKDSLNSLESVLSEVIRIEFQAFSNLAPESRVKEEQLQSKSNNLQMPDFEEQRKKACFNVCNTQIQQPVFAPSNVMCGRELNEAEQLKLRELKLASEALYYPMDNDLSILMMGDERMKVKNNMSMSHIGDEPFKTTYISQILTDFNNFCTEIFVIEF